MSNCIRCKFAKAGATPSLCLGCFKRTAFEWYKFNHPNVNMFAFEVYEAQFKAYLNNLQKKIKQAHKSHEPT